MKVTREGVLRVIRLVTALVLAVMLLHGIKHAIDQHRQKVKADGGSVLTRLERIEAKLDRLLEQRGAGK